jgi:uncharacterized phage protein gp47/JayE
LVGQPTVLFTNRDGIASPGGVVTGQTFVCADTGPVAVPPGTLAVIATPFPGWSAITNPGDGVLGTNEETDAELRQRRLEAPIRGALASDPRVKKVLIYENNTDFTVGILGPHSFEAVVWDGTVGGTNISDQEIADLLFLDKPAGIQTFGAITKTVIDSVGLSHTIKFSRPTLVPIWLAVQVRVGPGWDVVNGPALVKAALVAFGAARYDAGVDVVHTSLFGPVYEVPGVTDTVQVFLDLVVFPVATLNIVIAERDIAQLATARITVTVLP